MRSNPLILDLFESLWHHGLLHLIQEHTVAGDGTYLTCKARTVLSRRLNVTDLLQDDRTRDL